MNRTDLAVAVVLIATLSPGPAAAWTSANRYGGSTTHTSGGTEHTSAYGTSTAHATGGGTEHTNAYGGTTAGKYGEGAYHSGATAYHPPAYHPPTYYPYHPPVAVPYYSSSGCTGCAVAAGVVVGAAVGSAAASANTAAATSNAYNAGVAAGASGAAAPASYVMGVSYAALPAGSTSITKSGATYYLYGNTCFKPTYGANGVHYVVVLAP
jgi:hypothetical protein